MQAASVYEDSTCNVYVLHPTSGRKMCSQEGFDARTTHAPSEIHSTDVKK